ncbi:two-component regulator propeller domain-containing protein [Chryseobacterium sp. 3008163]|uniref:two-component regulator propeller domain-containing protein n=1 Tax=Chryseobacterium sp. 3008163 TaxID=2478663 RepID=UPI000F0D192B|nr:two-component regulator propeller domain-containing protein [Chryseobacterium sp. 3008163]AYN01333.1 hypothetical protein EAG08_14365 [Chryseobacterium sp. 3008163]
MIFLFYLTEFYLNLLKTNHDESLKIIWSSISSFFEWLFFAQNYSLNNTFHTDNSKLPSNLIFDLEQDDKGFLWIATEDGLSRFDGLNFFNYTIKNGLPSNSVLQVVKDKSGKIWAICYKQPPSFLMRKTTVLSRRKT